MDDYDVLECGFHPSPLGEALLVRVHRQDMAPMGWRELWEAFQARYPGRWALQLFPAQSHLLDQANKYHLWVLDERPTCFDLIKSW